ncbi:hypothetical protein ACFZCY_42720 [Streptomyces sp. NPDC007983]|uniref:NucA/NucB deoxyribonuclease domain-containing protein n=1 Tax=Streptomyces sp. NPDC007983 TaxID=3364800 RepID=UPI0036F10CB9
MLAMPATAAPASKQSQTSETAQMYIIQQPDLARDPSRILKAARSGGLEKLGLQPLQGTTSRSEAANEAQREEPASYTVDSARFNRGRKPADPYQYTNENGCRARSESYRTQGWVKNRYSYCKTELVYVPITTCSIPPFPPRCRITAEYMAWHTILGEGKIGAYAANPAYRWAKFTLRVTPVKVTGRFRTPSSRLSVQMECSGDYRNDIGLPNSRACHPGTTNGRSDTVPGWLANRQATMELVSDAYPPAASRTPQIAVGVFRPHLTLTWKPAGKREWRMPEGGMRFDSAWYLTTNQKEQLGSVFDRARPGLTHRLNNRAIQQLAKHIHEARTNPKQTVPVSANNNANKHLPGATPNDPIRRLAPGAGEWQQTRYDANVALTRDGFCRSAGMPDRPSRGGPFDCDEYPFASTYEGAARYKYEGSQYLNFWSARWVKRTHNQEGGRRLARWYTNDRILDHDYFYIPTPAR